MYFSTNTNDNSSIDDKNNDVVIKFKMYLHLLHLSGDPNFLLFLYRSIIKASLLHYSQYHPKKKVPVHLHNHFQLHKNVFFQYFFSFMLAVFASNFADTCGNKEKQATMTRYSRLFSLLCTYYTFIIFSFFFNFASNILGIARWC